MFFAPSRRSLKGLTGYSRIKPSTSATSFSVRCPSFRRSSKRTSCRRRHLNRISRERFRGLLKRAREGAGVTTFELDGNRSAAPNAYALGGRVVLNQSDLLVVVWDGQNRAGDGSTVDTAQEAIRFRVPVLWIDALAPRNWQLLRDAEDMRCLEGNDRCMPRDHGSSDTAQARKSLAEAVRRIVHQEIAPPDPSAGLHQAQTTQSQAKEYFRERKPRFNFAFAWKLFRDAVGSASFHLPKVLVPDFESQVRKTWPVSSDVGDLSLAHRRCIRPRPKLAA